MIEDPVILSERECLERDIVTHARAYVRAKEAPNVSSQRAYIKLAQSIAELARHENNYKDGGNPEKDEKPYSLTVQQPENNGCPKCSGRGMIMRWHGPSMCDLCEGGER